MTLLLFGIAGWFWIVYTVATVILIILVDKGLFERIVLRSQAIWLLITIISLFLGTPFKLSGVLSGMVIWLFIGTVVYNLMAVWRLGIAMTNSKREEATLEVVFGEEVEEDDIPSVPRLRSGK